jgi:flagellar biosynthesis protein FlhG
MGSEAEIIELAFPARAPVAKKTPASAKSRARRVIAVGGGKGGIGKSLVSANLGIALARRGAKVVLVDLDLGGANLHTCLGVGQPKTTLGDFVERKVDKLEDVLVPTRQERLSLVSGALDELDAANPKHAQKTKLIRNLRLLDVDYVVLDLGAGTAFNVLDFFLTADTGVVVMLPEPTSIENAYRFIKAAFFRRLQTLTPEEDFAARMAKALSVHTDGAIRTPWDVVAELRLTEPEKATALEHALSGFHPWLIINQARTRADFDVGPTVCGAWKKFFGLELGYLGAVNHDDAVWQAVRSRRALLDAAPQCLAANAVLRVAENLIALER